jgi:hypothetical protein
MHANKVNTDVFPVSRLLAAQFPQWADLSIRSVRKESPKLLNARPLWYTDVPDTKSRRYTL